MWPRENSKSAESSLLTPVQANQNRQVRMILFRQYQKFALRLLRMHRKKGTPEATDQITDLPEI